MVAVVDEAPDHYVQIHTHDLLLFSGWSLEASNGAMFRESFTNGSILCATDLEEPSGLSPAPLLA